MTSGDVARTTSAARHSMPRVLGGLRLPKRTMEACGAELKVWGSFWSLSSNFAFVFCSVSWPGLWDITKMIRDVLKNKYIYIVQNKVFMLV